MKKILDNKIILLFISLIVIGSIISFVVMIIHYVRSLFHNKNKHEVISNARNAMNKADIAVNSAKHAEASAKNALNSAKKALNSANSALNTANSANMKADLNFKTYANSAFHGTSNSNSNTQGGVEPNYWKNFEDKNKLPRAAMESGDPWNQRLSNWPVEGVIYEGFNVNGSWVDKAISIGGDVLSPYFGPVAQAGATLAKKKLQKK